MEFQQKHIKFLAQQYMDGNYMRKTRRTPLLQKRCQGSNTDPFFPGINSGRQSRRQDTPDSRLTIDINRDSPGPAAYSPPMVNYRETNAPSYTFGRENGGRRLPYKNPFIKKVDFVQQSNWPSPADYALPVGVQPPNRPNAPRFTISKKGAGFNWVNKDSLNYPGPSQYNTDSGYAQVLARSPSYVFTPGPHHIFVWTSKEGTPGPGTYDVAAGSIAALPSSPSFFIQGVRRPKKHETGPFTTL